jgi:MinD-like ATPase involved in chromosome partitioning or flagellar assembly
LSEKGGTRVITITSGKGGVGKTNISVNLALHLAALDNRVCLFDADLGLANINILLRLDPEHNLEDVILKRHSLQDIMIGGYKGVDIIPGSSGVEKMANLENDQIEHLVRSFSELEGYDFLLIDTSAGVSKNVLAFCLASPEIILIITPEPTSLTDAYSLLKVLTLNGFQGTAKTVVNQCKNIQTAKLVHNKFKETVKKYLHMDIMLLGVVIQDQKVVEAIRAQQALISAFPDSNASKCIKLLGKKLLEYQPEDLKTSSIMSFWDKCLQLIKGPLNVNGPAKNKKGINPEPSKGHPLKISDHITQEKKQQNEPEASIAAKKAVKSLEDDYEKKSKNLYIVERQTPTEKTGVFSESQISRQIEQNMPSLMSKLVDSVSSVSLELQLIRKAIEEQGKNIFDITKLTDGGQGALDHKSTILDFEGFLKERGLGMEENDDKQKQ